MDLLTSNCKYLVDPARKDTIIWGEIYNIINTNVSLVDRTKRFQMPYRFGLAKGFELPTDIENFNLSFEEVCQKRVKELLALQDRVGKPLLLLYSGGIDSTIVLISFMKELSASDLRNRVRVLMNGYSIGENPKFYFKYIRKMCTIRSSEHFLTMFNGSGILVGGEHNDQLFGSDVCSQYLGFYPFQDLVKPYTREKITRFFAKRGFSKSNANIWFDMIDASAKSAPCEVKTVFDFFWWFNFVFKWQVVYYRSVLRVERRQRKFINEKFLATHYHHFFTFDDFQRWSMSHMELKIKDDWSTYKFHVKDLIYRFIKDDEFRKFNVIVGCFCRMFLSRDSPISFTTNFNNL